MSISKEFREDFKDKEYAHSYLDEFLNIFIATQIKVLREERELTQRQLADLAGMKQSRIAVLENVNYSAWSINTLRKLAKAFDVALRVSFETFGNQSQKMDDLHRLSLERTPREKEIELDELIEARLASNQSIVFENITMKVHVAPPSLIMPQAESINRLIYKPVTSEVTIASTATGISFNYHDSTITPQL